MYTAKDTYRNIRLVQPDDPEYIRFKQLMAERRPSRGGPRSAGEYLGGIVEQCVRHWLQKFVPLQEERILGWEQLLRNGRVGSMFRELDGVWTIDPVSLCLFEMKLTFAENMENGVGLKQLDIAADTLFLSKRYEYILQRLVYVASERVTVLDGLPELEPDDEYAELGVIWVPPDAVVAAAQELGLELPENWLEPESREGYLEDPEREEWRQYADTERSLEAEEGEEPPASSPMAEALRRAMQQKP